MQQVNPAAGGVVIGPDGHILVVSQNGDSWSLPKGRLDPGEDAKTAAIREILEESGISQLEFIKELGVYERFRIGKGGIGDDRSHLKSITIFLFRTNQASLNPTDPVNPEARWVDPNEVAKLLTHPKDRAFYLSILPEVRKYLN